MSIIDIYVTLVAEYTHFAMNIYSINFINHIDEQTIYFLIIA